MNKKIFIIIVLVLLIGIIGSTIIYWDTILQKYGILEKKETTKILSTQPHTLKTDSYYLIGIEDLKNDPELKKHPAELVQVDKSLQEYKSMLADFKKDDQKLSEKEIEDLTKAATKTTMDLLVLRDKVFQTTTNKTMGVDGIMKVMAYINTDINPVTEVRKNVCVRCLLEDWTVDSKQTRDERAADDLKKFEKEFPLFLEKSKNIYAADGPLTVVNLFYFTIEFGNSGEATDDQKKLLKEQADGLLQDVANTQNLEVSDMMTALAKQYGVDPLNTDNVIAKIKELTKQNFEKYNLNQYRFYDNEMVSFLLYEDILKYLKTEYDYEQVQNDFFAVSNLIGLLPYLDFKYMREGEIGRTIGNDGLTMLDLADLIAKDIQIL